MPKRPSALALTPDGQTILCADKFGDAYSLPLIPGEYTPRVEEAKAFKPAATNLTVHSQRNLQTLKNQIMQFEKEAKKSSSKDSNADENVASGFEHQLILGHVSLLTDLIAVSLPTDASVNRSYILTADRDEHIRVSRGLPQSHVIEKYCLGHTSFINKLCIPSWAPQYLISGGGDDFLLLWKWNEGKALQKVPLEGVSQESEFSVRGIWAVSAEQSAGSPVQSILVGLEGYVHMISNCKCSTKLTYVTALQLSSATLSRKTLSSTRIPFSSRETSWI
jgi:tRNA (guanine-N(7)-)-methyltransferase subunit TRM82